MRTRAEEEAVFAELFHRHATGTARIYRAPDTEYSHAYGPRTREKLKRIKHLPVYDGTPDVAICMLHRGTLTYPDNVVSPCVDCGAVLQHRPDLPTRMARICCFCILKRDEANHD